MYILSSILPVLLPIIQEELIGNQKLKKLSWGLIGCGDIVLRRVAPALADLENCDLQAVSRKQADLLKPFADRFHVPKTFSDWRDLVRDPDINAVYIATPVYLHLEQALAAAEAGKHVLCEKPMAMNSEECGQMIDACRVNGIQLGVAYYRHFYPVLTRVKEIIVSGEIGQVALSDIHAFSNFNAEGGFRGWLLDGAQAGGGPMIDFGSHRIEVFLNLFGPIKKITAVNRNLRYTDRNVEDTSIAVFDHENMLSILNVTHTVQEPKDTLMIYGTGGSIHINSLNEGDLTVLTSEGKRKESHPPHVNIHQPLIEDFTEAVLNNREPVVTGEIGMAVTEVIDGVYGGKGLR